MLGKSWRTSSLGIIAILTAVLGAAKALLDGDPATNVDYPALIATVSAGIGLLKARDNVVTSEQAGAK